jgi:hypothetical protein
MIRPITLITALMFVLSGAYLFVVKHRSQMLDDQLSATAQATRLDEQRIVVLQAQWAKEADPSRLARLSSQFMSSLQPMQPNQLVTLATLASELPPPGSAAPGSAGDSPSVVPAAPLVAQASAPAPAVAPAQRGQPAPVVVAQPAPVVVAANAAPAAPAAETLPAASAAKISPHVPGVKISDTALAVNSAGMPLAVSAVAPAPERAPVRLASVEALLHRLPEHHAARPRHVWISREYAENRRLPERRRMVETASALAPQAPAVVLADASSVEPAPMAQVHVQSAPMPAPMPAPMDDGGSMLGMAQGGGN